jgi:hypothetical protein
VTSDRARDDASVRNPGKADSAEEQAAAEQAAARADAAQRFEQQTLWVDAQIRQATRRGEFDNLPGAGKPIKGIPDTHDPDWWVKNLIKREQLTGLGPPAILLRTEDRELDDRLDRVSAEAEVRRILDDFNARVVDARRQLLGGPPVVTKTRDVDAEVAAWRERRSERIRRLREASPRDIAEPEPQQPTSRRRRWWRRGRPS